MARAAAIVGLLLAARPLSALAQTPQQATISITAALVAQELEVKPVALHELRLVRSSDTTQIISLRTGLDGKAKQVVAPGSYRLRSVSPVQLLGKSYRWDVPVTLLKGKVSDVELTNVNSMVEPVAAPATAQPAARQVAPEIAVYERVKRGVVRVEAGLKRGSGFFIDTLGRLIVTNDHVIAGERSLSVSLDTKKRVPAQLVTRDHDADLALLRLNPGACPDCQRLRIAKPDSTGSLVVPGERVIAVGFPLHQQSVVTSGIVSSVRERAIISDVNIAAVADAHDREAAGDLRRRPYARHVKLMGVNDLFMTRGMRRLRFFSQTPTFQAHAARRGARQPSSQT